MSAPNSNTDDELRLPWMLGVGPRLTAWVVVLFVVTLVVFVALDIRHESAVARALGAADAQLAELRSATIRLHALHGVVTAIVFGVMIRIVVRRRLTRRIESIVLTVQRFRRGTWKVPIPTRSRDEIEWLVEAFRRLGPELEEKLLTYVAADRKSVVARLGLRYEQAIEPPARRLIERARRARENGDAAGWREVEQCAMRILADIGRLGRPEHPSVTEIVGVRDTEGILSEEHHGRAPRNRTGSTPPRSAP